VFICGWRVSKSWCSTVLSAILHVVAALAWKVQCSSTASHCAMYGLSHYYKMSHSSCIVHMLSVSVTTSFL
jgi:hypothetical protein